MMSAEEMIYCQQRNIANGKLTDEQIVLVFQAMYRCLSDNEVDAFYKMKIRKELEKCAIELSQLIYEANKYKLL